MLLVNISTKSLMFEQSIDQNQFSSPEWIETRFLQDHRVLLRLVNWMEINDELWMIKIRQRNLFFALELMRIVENWKEFECERTCNLIWICRVNGLGILTVLEIKFALFWG